jgi:hypothetical protein
MKRKLRIYTSFVSTMQENITVQKWVLNPSEKVQMLGNNTRK